MKIRYILIYAFLGFVWVHSLKGNDTYKTICSACHQVNGEGVEGVFPPLKGWVDKLAKTDDGRMYLIQVISFGMNDTIDIKDISYIGYMPPNPQLNDGEVANLLNFLIRDLSKNTSLKEFSESEVMKVRRVRTGMDQVSRSRIKAIESLGK